jgi:hypothetical protein
MRKVRTSSSVLASDRVPGRACDSCLEFAMLQAFKNALPSLIPHKPQVRPLEVPEAFRRSGKDLGHSVPGLAIVGDFGGDPSGTPSAGDQSAEAVFGDYRSRLRAA